MTREWLAEGRTKRAWRSRSPATEQMAAPVPAHPALQLQSTIGNRAATGLIQAQVASTSRVVPASALRVGLPGDRYEREADRAARRVVSTPLPGVQRQAGGEAERAVEAGRGVPGHLGARGSSPLPRAVRAFMEPRFGADFSQVRVHTGADAARMNSALHARAFTHRHDIYFGEGRSPGADALTAHELAHVVQQTGGEHANAAPGIQRAIELRPPGRGEASAYGRRQELVDRLNRQSAAIQYRLSGRQLVYDIVDAAALTHFDRQMRGFIDRVEVAPMRLITSAGLVLNAAGAYETMVADQFVSAYVDLDDLLATDDLSFQSILIHFLTERFHVPRYEQRIGTGGLAPHFPGAHGAGHRAQAAHFQAIFNDPSIYYNYEAGAANGDYHIVFRSRTHMYRVFLILRQAARAVVSAEVKVRTTDKRWLSVDDFLAERAAAELRQGCIAHGTCPQ